MHKKIIKIDFKKETFLIVFSFFNTSKFFFEKENYSLFFLKWSTKEIFKKNILLKYIILLRI